VAGCTELAEDARFSSNGKRVENRVEITRLLQAIFSTRKTKDWVEALEAAGVPNGPINNIAQVFEEEQVKARKIKIELDHPVAGKMPLVASPMRFSGTPIEHKLAPPTLGQHTEEVLRALGKGDSEIVRLRGEGIV
jgi:crotonobetainyl-CoA:carnitine CoA-transferase CaiB-like acyl-CoA transferase